MPKRYRKKYRKRKRKRRKRGSVIRVPGLIMCDTAYTTLRYSQNFIVIGVASVEHLTFAGNGLADPGLTHSSQQPGGFSQWMAFFERYEVISSKFSLKATNLISRPYCLTLTPKNINTSTGADSTIEQRYSRNKIVGNIANASSTRSMYNKMNTRKLVGRPVSSVNFTGSSTMNPTAEWYWKVVMDSIEPDPGGGIPLVNTDIRVAITYYVKFSKRNYAID